MFGGRGHHVLAAAERANGVDGAALVFEKWAGDAKREVPQSESVVLVFIGQRDSAKALCQAALFEAVGSVAKAGVQRFPSLIGLGVDPFGEHACLDRRDGHRLAAAGAAALAATHGFVDAGGLALSEAANGIRQVLNDGEKDRGTDRSVGKLRVYVNPGAMNFQSKLERLQAGRFGVWAGHSGQSSTKAVEQGSGIRAQGLVSRAQVSAPSSLIPFPGFSF